MTATETASTTASTTVSKSSSTTASTSPSTTASMAAYTTAAVRVELPASLCRLAALPHHEVQLHIAAPVTQRSLLDALEALHPALRGTLRDHTTHLRRPFIRFFACGEDISHGPPDTPLPPSIASGAEPFLIIGAIAGG